MMLIVERVLGSRLDRSIASQIDEFEHRHRIDTLCVPQAELTRRRFQTTSTDGRQLAVALPRDQKLYDGAVLVLEDDYILVVRVDKQKWLHFEPGSLSDAIELGYRAGNLHWRVRFEGASLLVALEAPAADYLDRLAPLIAKGRVLSSVIEGE